MAMAANRVGIVRRAGIVRRVIVNKVVRVVTIVVLAEVVKVEDAPKDAMKAGTIVVRGAAADVLSRGSPKSSWRS
jgi:hypothetical protein